MRNYFPQRPSGAPLHTLSKLYDVPIGFVPHPLFWGRVLLYLRLPKGGCCWISDDLPCSYEYRDEDSKDCWYEIYPPNWGSRRQLRTTNPIRICIHLPLPFDAKVTWSLHYMANVTISKLPHNYFPFVNSNILLSLAYMPFCVSATTVHLGMLKDITISK